MLILFSLGCYSPDRYSEDLGEARCATYERCDTLGVLGFDSLDHCIELNAGLGLSELSCDTFEVDAARECVRGWTEIGCDEMSTPPSACEETCSSETSDSGA